MNGSPPIEWRVHLKSPPELAFDFWATDQGRESFWAERSAGTERGFQLEFINAEAVEVDVLEAVRRRRLVFRYFGGSTVTVTFAAALDGGTELLLVETGVPADCYDENRAGWVSVLLTLKAAADHGVDLRGHDPQRTWEQRYVDN